MNEHQQTLETLKDIRSMMDRSSRFISLSGLSGVAAGTCALVGAWVARGVIQSGVEEHSGLRNGYEGLKGSRGISITVHPGSTLLLIAVVTFFSAVLLAFIFTWMRSRKTGVSVFGPISWRLILAVGLPILIGSVFLIKLMEAGTFGLIAPACLLFYGLGLINASRFTTSEIRFLGYAILAVGVLNLFFTGHGLYFWAFGFGVLHILYGILMWYRYERS
ncbi:MAG TPA: hypothetical protein VK907_08415 [Phnomibacter sp.]|nr:hypothetical protein [Phnomibacter sp.]